MSQLLWALEVKLNKKINKLDFMILKFKAHFFTVTHIRLAHHLIVCIIHSGHFTDRGEVRVYGRDNLQVFHLLNLAALVLAKTLTNLLFGKGSFVTLTLARQVPSVLTSKDVFISTKIN